jgi:D-alanine-D-alanine ligase
MAQLASGKSTGSRKKVAIIFTQLLPDATEEQKDILLDVDLISNVLIDLGYIPTPIPATLDLAALIRKIQELSPLFVFNLVDSLVDYDKLIQLVPAVFDAFLVPYTGVSARGHFLTTDKILAKEMMCLAGIPTPAWQRCDDVLADGLKVPLPCIIKPVSFDASREINERSVCDSSQAATSRIAAMDFEKRSEFMAEEYIDGREFNLSAIGLRDGVRIFPPAEMTFVDYPAEKPAIVDYNAKWVPGSFEFSHTVRKFDFPQSDQSLIEKLKTLSLQCWSLFGLCGYARVDFRIDKQGVPWVLEINANPCISPDAGFVAAGGRAGLSYTDLIEAIVEDALRRRPQQMREEEQKAKRRAHRSMVDKKR